MKIPIIQWFSSIWGSVGRAPGVGWIEAEKLGKPRLMKIIGLLEFLMVLLDFFGILWINWNFEGFSTLYAKTIENSKEIITFSQQPWKTNGKTYTLLRNIVKPYVFIGFNCKCILLHWFSYVSSFQAWIWAPGFNLSLQASNLNLGFKYTRSSKESVWICSLLDVFKKLE